MSKPKLIALKGLPASGKSTAAKKLTEAGFIRTNKDDIRESLFCGNYKRKDEKTVIRIRDSIISDALSHRRSVVVDDTNFNPVHIKTFESLAQRYNADFELDDSFLNVPLDVCIKRDLQRPKSVGERVIRDMYHQYIKTPKNAPQYNPDLPMAIIVDIDGTLAHMDEKRNPFEWHKVGGDRVDEGVAHLVDAINYINYAKVFIFSGRDEICRSQTVEWLERNDLEYESLCMRPSNRIDENGNQVKDTVIKSEMYHKYIEGKYNILFIVDDRPPVCRMWRDDFGFRVLQVGDPYLDF